MIRKLLITLAIFGTTYLATPSALMASNWELIITVGQSDKDSISDSSKINIQNQNHTNTSGNSNVSKQKSHSQSTQTLERYQKQLEYLEYLKYMQYILFAIVLALGLALIMAFIFTKQLKSSMESPKGDTHEAEIKKISNTLSRIDNQITLTFKSSLRNELQQLLLNIEDRYNKKTEKLMDAIGKLDSNLLQLSKQIDQMLSAMEEINKELSRMGEQAVYESYSPSVPQGYKPSQSYVSSVRTEIPSDLTSWDSIRKTLDDWERLPEYEKRRVIKAAKELGYSVYDPLLEGVRDVTRLSHENDFSYMDSRGNQSRDARGNKIVRVIKPLVLDKNGIPVITGILQVI